MKNKKSIAIAMSVMSAAGAVIPTFAHQNDVETVIPSGKSVDVMRANGKKIEAVHMNDLTEFLKANKDAKIIGKTMFGDKDIAYYVVELDDKQSNAAIQEIYKAEVEIAKEELTKLSKVTYEVTDENGKKKQLPRYVFGQNITPAKVNDEFKPVRSKNTITVKDNLNEHDIQYYTFFGVDTNYVYTPEAEIVRKEVDGTKKVDLNLFIYKMQQAVKKHDIVVKNRGYIDGAYRIAVLTGDGKVKLAQIDVTGDKSTIEAKKLPEGKEIPLDNDFVGHWAEDEIVEQMIRGNISKNKNFRPKENITRAEFAVMVYNNHSGDLSGTPTEKYKFKDVAKDSWYTDAIQILASYGHINGYTDGTFKPHAEITRQEAAAILSSVRGHRETTYTDAYGKQIHTDVQTNFKDDKNIAVWADESVENLTKNEILRGYSDKTFRPKNNISRAEAACIVNRSKNTKL